MLFSSHTLFYHQPCLRAVLALHYIFQSFRPPLNTAHLLRRLLLQNPLLLCSQVDQFCWIFSSQTLFLTSHCRFLPPHALPQEHLSLHLPSPEDAGGSTAFEYGLMEWAQNKSRPNSLTHPTDQKRCCWTDRIFDSGSQPAFPVNPQHWQCVTLPLPQSLALGMGSFATYFIEFN